MNKIGRRTFLKNVCMFFPLIGSYTLAAGYALRFLYPKKSKKSSRMFVTFVSRVPPGRSHRFTTPSGDNFLLTNIGMGINPYIAFSDRCPHLGCKVYWRQDENIFFCPCHEGAFDDTGTAIQGPPSKAGQRLQSCRIEVYGSSIYAVVET